jgi:hypothetical protein
VTGVCVSLFPGTAGVSPAFNFARVARPINALKARNKIARGNAPCSVLISNLASTLINSPDSSPKFRLPVQKVQIVISKCADVVPNFADVTRFFLLPLEKFVVALGKLQVAIKKFLVATINFNVATKQFLVAI